MNGASLAVRLDERLREEPGAAEDQRAADDLLELVMLLSPIVFATSTPTSESGAEPSEHPAARAARAPCRASGGAPRRTT